MPANHYSLGFRQGIFSETQLPVCPILGDSTVSDEHGVHGSFIPVK